MLHFNFKFDFFVDTGPGKKGSCNVMFNRKEKPICPLCVVCRDVRNTKIGELPFFARLHLQTHLYGGPSVRSKCRAV